MIEPEVCHDLLELALGEDGAEELGLGELAGDLVGGSDVGCHAVEDLALSGVEVAEKEIFLVAGDVGSEGDAVGDGELDNRGHTLVAGKREEVSGNTGGGGLIGLFLGGELVVGGLRDDMGAVGVELMKLVVAVEFVDLDLIHGGKRGVSGGGTLALGDLLDDAAVREECESLLGGHVEGGELGKAAVQDVVGDGGGVELLLKPLIWTDSEDVLDVAGAGAEGEAVQELDGAFAGS